MEPGRRCGIMGRRTFAPQQGPWGEDEWRGWWGDEPSFQTPVFVMTHDRRAARRRCRGSCRSRCMQKSRIVKSLLPWPGPCKSEHSRVPRPFNCLDRREEEEQPGVDVPALTHTLEESVVVGSMLLEVARQVEQGVSQAAPPDQLQVDQQAADPPVAIQERMDRLELVTQCINAACAKAG